MNDQLPRHPKIGAQTIKVLNATMPSPDNKREAPLDMEWQYVNTATTSSGIETDFQRDAHLQDRVQAFRTQNAQCRATLMANGVIKHDAKPAKWYSIDLAAPTRPTVSQRPSSMPWLAQTARTGERVGTNTDVDSARHTPLEVKNEQQKKVEYAGSRPETPSSSQHLGQTFLSSATTEDFPSAPDSLAQGYADKIIDAPYIPYVPEQPAAAPTGPTAALPPRPLPSPLTPSVDATRAKTPTVLSQCHKCGKPQLPLQNNYYAHPRKKSPKQELGRLKAGAKNGKRGKLKNQKITRHGTPVSPVRRAIKVQTIPLSQEARQSASSKSHKFPVHHTKRKLHPTSINDRNRKMAHESAPLVAITSNSSRLTSSQRHRTAGRKPCKHRAKPRPAPIKQSVTPPLKTHNAKPPMDTSSLAQYVCIALLKAICTAAGLEC